jgi:hypothetical protein
MEIGKGKIGRKSIRRSPPEFDRHLRIEFATMALQDVVELGLFQNGAVRLVAKTLDLWQLLALGEASASVDVYNGTSIQRFSEACNGCGQSARPPRVVESDGVAGGFCSGLRDLGIDVSRDSDRRRILSTRSRPPILAPKNSGPNGAVPFVRVSRLSPTHP